MALSRKRQVHTAWHVLHDDREVHIHHASFHPSEDKLLYICENASRGIMQEIEMYGQTNHVVQTYSMGPICCDNRFHILYDQVFGKPYYL